MKTSEQNHRLQQTLLLAPDLRQSVLAELGHGGHNRLAYTPYGSQSAQRPVATYLGFNGEFRDPAQGWYHLGNGYRVFNPILMRFHSPDRLSPFGEGGLNPYAYCVGDPINYRDPTGQVPSWLGPVVAIGLHIGLLVLNSFAALVTPPVGFSLLAFNISRTGSLIAITGAGFQLGGQRYGVYVSAVGTVLSTVSAGLKIYDLVPKVVAKVKAAPLDGLVKLTLGHGPVGKFVLRGVSQFTRQTAQNTLALQQLSMGRTIGALALRSATEAFGAGVGAAATATGAGDNTSQTSSRDIRGSAHHKLKI